MFENFHYLFGEENHFDEHIFQMGWNHQPVIHNMTNIKGILATPPKATPPVIRVNKAFIKGNQWLITLNKALFIGG